MKLKFAAAFALLVGLFVGNFYIAKADGDNPFLVSAPQAAVPPNIVTTANKPMVMLAASKDQALFSPIYTDFEDIDGDGVMDTTYKPTYKYYGYFDAVKCYAYSSSDKRFNPDSMAIMAAGRYTCDPSKSLWSGNFLNWSTMSRVDVIRKMLYGGKRSLDGVPNSTDSINTVTVLDRVNLSKDSHSYVKSYYGQDIRDYTPFAPADLVRSDTETENPGVYAGLTICNRSDQMSPDGNPVIRMAKGNYKMWSLVEGPVCSWIDENKNNFGSKAPRYFFDADKGNGGIRHEKNPPSKNLGGAIYASSIGPEIYARVRVCDPNLLGEEHCQAFPSGSTHNFKPYGVFQEFGLGSTANAAARAEFGVITGSYDLNLTAGALRKNMGDFYDEINPATGVFCHSINSGCAATASGGRPTGQGAIKTFDNIKLVGRTGGGDYTGSNFQRPMDMADGVLPAWGNPIGEMVTQTLRYFSGGSSTNPTTTTNDVAAGLPVVSWQDPLSVSDTQRSALYGNPICRPMYAIALSSSSSSFDESSQNDFSVLPNNLLGSLSNYVNSVGVNENIVGQNGIKSVGAIDGSFGNNCILKQVGNLSDATGVCPEAPAVKGTWQVAGSSLYANTSQVRDLSKLSNIPSDLGKVQDALKVKTLAASLQGGVPRIEIPIPNSNPRKYVYITPESLWEYYEKLLVGGILTFQSINSGDRYGTFIVTWNDRLFGGDYDMDISGFLRYDILDDPKGGYNLKITTDIVNVGSGMWGTHGFSVMGTDRDGRYLTHKHGNNYKLLDAQEGFLCRGSGHPATVPSRCNVSSDGMTVYDQDFPYSETFKMVGVDNALLQDPLWYAAKYGYPKSSKVDATGNYVNMSPADFMQDIKNNSLTWDNLNADGSPGQDNVPDGFFLARRPELLEAQLRKVLESMAKTANAAPAVSTSVMTEGSLKYAVNFDTSAISGEVSAYKLQSDGTFSSGASWSAGQALKVRTAADQGNDRSIITNEASTAGGGQGFPFRWSEINASASARAAYKVQMTTASTNPLSAANAQLALNYVRGDQSLENSTTGLRVRGSSLLGPVINSTPWLQTRPVGNFYGAIANGYSDFYSAKKTRANLLWVAANDGMLHAFSADESGGREIFAYVPGVLANRLAEIPLQRGTGIRTQVNGASYVAIGQPQTQPDGTVWAYVDGNPFTADVKRGNASAATNVNWYTYAFGTLGRGGKAIYALDVTDTASTNLSESNASNIFKWQFSSADDNDLGYVTGAAIKRHPSSNQASPIAVMNNGKFAMIVGNGQKSTNGKAALFILYIDGPSSTGGWTGRYEKIVVDGVGANGLSTPRWEDVNGDGTADYIYAGDLKGNLWKFDVTDSSSSNWGSAYGTSSAPLPLFRATTTVVQNGSNVTVGLPITAAPQLTYMAQGGLMVTVGTGNAFVAGDFPRNDISQRVYGVWDRGAAIATPVLMPRAYSRASDGTVTLSTGTGVMDWANYPDGWMLTMPSTGEAVLSDLSFDAGVLWFISTRPKSAASQCSDLPDTALYTIDPISGRAERATLGTVMLNGALVNVAGANFGDPQGVLSRPTINPNPKQECVAGTPGCVCVGSVCTKQASMCPTGQRAVNVVGSSSKATLCYSVAPRLQWREIPGLRTYQ